MLINISQIKVNDRIRKDFGNIEELANDIRDNGLINPPVVTPDNELIAGERRLRACKSLGYQQIEVRVMSVKDSEHQLQIEISENENRKDFTFSERVDWAKRLERVEIIKAKERQLSALNNQDVVPKNSAERGETRQIVADKSGFGSHDTLNKAKYISENATEDMIKELDDGKLSVNKAYTTLKKEKQELEQYNKDLEKEKEDLEQGYESLSDQNDSLLLKNETLETQLEQALDKKLAVDNTDYATIDELKKKLASKDEDVALLKKKMDLLERKVKLNEEDAKKFNDLKTQIAFLNTEKEDIGRRISSATELSGLAVEIDHILKTKLAPIRYSRTLERMDSEVAVNNLSEIIESVESWCRDMRQFLPNEGSNIIDVEVLSR